MTALPDAGHVETLPLPLNVLSEFTLVDDVYDELFQLYSESDQAGWQHNHAVKQKAGSVEIEVENVKGNKPAVFTVMQNQSLLSKRGITGSVLWDSSVMLSNMFTKHRQIFGLDASSTRILELGSGCGLLGITLTSLVKQVVLTDQYEMLSLLAKNIRRNLGENSNTDIAELMWGEPLPPHVRKQTFDLIVASDCVYHEALTGKLVNTLSDLCKSSDAHKLSEFDETGHKSKRTAFILGQELRSDNVHMEFLTDLIESFIVYRIPTKFVMDDFQNGYCIYFGFLR
jgi:predicted nicotinamide N-methyase